MPGSSIYINQIDLDPNFFVWATGQDLRKFNGTTWEYYDSSNSSVPSGSPYYLDTRSISIDDSGIAWCGIAQGPTSSYNSPCVFNIATEDVSIGESWNFSDLGTFTSPQEVSLSYASPYGNEALFFLTPLNGIGSTGATAYTRINGVTGGRLFVYNKNIENWKETLPGYTWPHIFDIKAKGYKGKEYKYFLGTSQGLWVIPPGILSTLSLNEGGEIVKQAKVYNTNTSGIISNSIYTIDFDENENLWIGTDLGISFFDGNRFWNYDTPGPVTYIKSRDNGHIFYSVGDGELSQGTGLWHFNGTTHTNLNSANSNLPNDNILEIDLIGEGTKQGNLTLYENSLWILSLNDLSSFTYDLPHVYASSKTEGATGWNFTYRVPLGGTGLTGAPPIPKINKYTWNYPEWQTYGTEFVASKLPGLDPRNLFLTVPLKDIADGKAGEQYYWGNSPIPSYDEKVLEEKIGLSLWNSPVGIGGSGGDVKITCSTSIETELGIKYFIGGYISGETEAFFGYYNDSSLAYINNLNPTIGGSGGTAGSSSYYGEMGFVVCYDYSGSVESILPFRGYKTRIDSLDPSPDDNSISVSGSYSWFIESGPWVWNSWEGSNSFSGNGATGSPYGATNLNYPGLTSGSYPWIYDPLSSFSVLFSSFWTYDPMATSTVSSGEFDFSYDGSGYNIENINGIYVSFIDDTSTDYTSQMESFVTANSIEVSLFPSVYTITSISSIPSGLFIGLIYQSGATGVIPFVGGTSLRLDFYEWNNEAYPLVKNIGSFPGTPEANSYGVFSAEIHREIGDKFSFTGITGDYNAGINSSYRVKKFRNFPVKNLNTLPGNNYVPLTSIQRTNYHTHLLIQSNLSGNFADLSTLKNDWIWTNDNSSVDNYLSDPAYTGLLSYVKLNNLDYSIQSNYNSNTPGSTGGWIRVGSEINSLDLGESVVITGSATGGFYFSGNYLSPSGSSNSPFYISITDNPVGSTGFYLESFGLTGNKIDVTKDKSNYYITTVVGSSGSYFGKNFVAEPDKTYFLTSKLTEQTVCKSIFYPSITGSHPSLDLKTTLKLPNEQFVVHYEDYDNLYTVKILKTDEDSRINDTVTIEGFNGDLTINNDSESNILFSGFNSLGLTGSAYVNFGYVNVGYFLDPNSGAYIDFGYVDLGYFVSIASGFVYLLKQYKPNLGINEGEIISRPGSDPWVWCDSHVKEQGSFEVPLMSTVVFNNYTSEIYGKNTNKWVLSNGVTGEEILNIKYSSYFIYTFTEEGEYTIYNEVLDSEGNVYATTGNGFIKVVNHKKMRIPGRKTGPINSVNYGVDEPFNDRSYQGEKLKKDLAKQQKEIQDKNKIKFSPGIVIPDNPDSTYRKIKKE
jgi:hypothetical protein